MRTDYHRSWRAKYFLQQFVDDSTVIMAQLRYGLAESTSSLRAGLAHGHMGVLREVHAAWKSAHTLCNLCAGFHVMYVHEIRKEKISIPCIICMCSFLKGGGGWETRLVFVSKNISVFTDDP